MDTLPSQAKFHKQTPEFSEDSVPAGLLGQHTTAEGVWGKVVVTEGQLVFRLLSPQTEEHVLDTSHVGIVAPQRPHQVVVNGPVKFHVEFYRL